MTPDEERDDTGLAPPEDVDTTVGTTVTIGEADDIDELDDIARETWRSLIGPTGYLPILLMLLGVMLVGPLVGDRPAGSIISVVFTGGTLLLTVFRSTDRPHLRKGATVLTVIAMAGAAVTAYIRHYVLDPDRQEDFRAEIIFSSIFLVLLVVALPLVLARAFGHREVSLNTVCATISGYLLIGLIFTATYRIFGGFAGPFFAQTDKPTPGDYSYFSFITLTTVGFGDLTARTDASRAFVMLEAVLGQIFIVTAVARVVSLLGASRSPRAR